VHDKRRMATRMQKLAGTMTREAVRILKQGVLNIESHASGADEYEIDLRDVDDQTLLELEAYLDQCLGPDPSSTRQKRARQSSTDRDVKRQRF
jgi:Bromodomain extra-terminal - transcription regulation